jgi:hypothetical protein
MCDFAGDPVWLMHEGNHGADHFKDGIEVEAGPGYRELGRGDDFVRLQSDPVLLKTRLYTIFRVFESIANPVGHHFRCDTFVGICLGYADGVDDNGIACELAVAVGKNRDTQQNYGKAPDHAQSAPGAVYGLANLGHFVAHEPDCASVGAPFPNRPSLATGPE